MIPKDKVKLKKDGTPMKPRGGRREGSGRKSKAEENELLDKLKVFDKLAFKALERGIRAGDYKYWNKFMEYRYGTPTKNVDITSDGEGFSMPLIQFFSNKK